MQGIDLVKDIQNATAPGPLAAQRPASVQEAPSPSETPPPSESPQLAAASRRRRFGWLYATADHLRRFFQAPAIQQTQSLMYRVEALADDVRRLSQIALEIQNETSSLSRKVDALVIRAQRPS